ncbi:MAG: hypothetical protein HOV76_30970 [Hamadaea sp.]|nr:hypothetical protein [Hamadaea sp.]
MADTETPVSKPRPRTADPGGLRVGVIVGGLVVALIAGFALGKAMGSPSASGGTSSGVTPTFNEASPHTHAMTGMTGSEVGGLSINAAGYTLVPKQTSLKTGVQDFRFLVTGPDGKPVSTFAVVHDRPLHFVLARRDLSGYQHLHPTMAPDGTWSVQVNLAQPGIWRAIADFTAIGAAGAQTAITLGTDLTVAGSYQPTAVPAVARQVSVDGYTVAYEGTLQIGATSPVLFRVFSDGKPVTVDPYLGSYGHLVFLRELDLAYVHTHPETQLTGGAVKFWATAPSTGTYRMFFDFQVSGKVHTAAFTLVFGN